LPGTRGTRQNVVALQHESKRVGLAVDAPYGASQTVIKPPAHLFKDVPVVSGSTTIDTGRVALILNPAVLLPEVCKKTAQVV